MARAAFMSPDRLAALAQCLQALSEARVPLTTVARAFGVEPKTLSGWVKRSGVGYGRVDRQGVDARDGEEWRDLAPYGVRVSSAGRVASMRSGYLLRARRLYGEDVVTVLHPRKQSISTERLVRMAFDGIDEARAGRPRQWSEVEIAALRSATTVEAAETALARWDRKAILAKARRLGVRLARREETAGAARPYLNPLWAEANALVPRGMPDDVRDDLISDLVLMRLEDEAVDMRAALKIVIRERNRMMGTYRERSLDAPIPGTDGFRLIETIPHDAEHF